jgi:hypothetical protein
LRPSLAAGCISSGQRGRLLLSGRNDNDRKAAAAEMGFSMQ